MNADQALAQLGAQFDTAYRRTLANLNRLLPRVDLPTNALAKHRITGVRVVRPWEDILRMTPGCGRATTGAERMFEGRYRFRNRCWEPVR